MQSTSKMPRRGSGIKLVFRAITVLKTVTEAEKITSASDLLDLQRWMSRRRRGGALGVGPGYSSA